ncbi:MAG: cation-translocating P-type ATPase [Chitinophagales bacterium]|nr:cation-translocating P-type ATPase [Chitinophagales bacterium]
MNHHLLPVAETYELYNSSADGLSTDESELRLQQYGENKLEERKKVSAALILLRQLKQVMILILIAAAVISIITGDIKDAIVIMAIVVLNAVIGFVQDYRAEKAMEALKKLSASFAAVRRAGYIHQLPAASLVPGDVVLLEAGTIVPADIRLTQVHSLRIEEAMLTGESGAVEKRTDAINLPNLPLGDRLNMAYKSTIVSYGRGEGIVVATGMNTEIGRIAQLLREKEQLTPLQKRLDDFGKKLSIIVIAICIVLFTAGWKQGANAITMLLTSISVAVAAIPEALPAVITIALASGAKRMIRQNALIRKLMAVETLGAVTYICSDKTGTITQNQMKVTDLWLSPSSTGLHDLSSKELLLLAMAMNHDVVKDENDLLIGDATEIALASYASSNFDHPVYSHGKRTHELPFDAERKRMTTIYPFNNKWLIVTKGAVESILEICHPRLDDPVAEKAIQFAQEGKRVLAYAIGILNTLPNVIAIDTIECRLRCIGLVAMMDAPREGVKQAIMDCYTAGITPVMITGDHPVTAKTIAMETGIMRKESDRLMTGAELDALTDDAYADIIGDVKVYARVSPEQKLRIIRILQQKNELVAMTGDGVNDAPALNSANIGIAMGITGTDVSKESAHMILLDDNFTSIIHAVREGRRIFDNIKKFIKYVMACNGGELWTICLAPLAGLPIPLLPVQILWINLVTDGLPGLALTAEPAEENVLNRPPRKQGEGFFAGGLGIHILWVGFLMGLVCFGIQACALFFGNDNWQTIIFTVLSISQMGHAMAIRSDTKSLFSQGVFGNRQLFVAVLFTLVLQVASIYVPFMQEILGTRPLSFSELIFCLIMSGIVFWAVEAEKYFKRNRMKKGCA